ncbi:hypothetical protein CEXT_595641 [Caerostris extrusa]|uniref:Uncharacterized protein n=1 Tax=Caerostris extrusa TaxID=172846 RepID=A0AAV4Y1D8_CAEEX|nr:hypothetical protein CEXT_595641 [Caerostris extrusa]
MCTAALSIQHFLQPAVPRRLLRSFEREMDLQRRFFYLSSPLIFRLLQGHGSILELRMDVGMEEDRSYITEEN